MRGNFRHGGRYTRLYDIWRHMKGRCYNKYDKKYYRYGERGIKVCEEWKNDFKEFHDWAMSNGYSDDLTIDRIDNDGNYEPSNCRWANAKRQANNRGIRKDAIVIVWNGQTKTLSEWSKVLGIKYNTLAERRRRGITLPKLFEGVSKNVTTEKRA